MLFNSFTFLLAFLPVSIAAYQLAARWSERHGNGTPVPAQAILFLASLAFLAWSGWANLLVMMVSLVTNFLILGRMQGARDERLRAWMITAVAFNLGYLSVFKYADFIGRSVTGLTGTSWQPLDIILPLAISFYTFEMITLVIDSWRSRFPRPTFLEFGLFATVFPHLIAGPLVRFTELKGDLRSLRPIEATNLAIGLSIFFVGLFKKSVVADSLAPIANNFFSTVEAGTPPGLIEAWLGTLAYACQIYFDFSGYTDMAIGLALIFAIRLPQNFNSPYKATSIVEFWNRWHISLSRFLRDYLYIPLGGNRKGELARWRNVMVTMLLGGLWHGASWNFVLWGAGHGLLIAGNHAFRKLAIPIPKLVGWGITFILVMALWVIFRTPDVSAAMRIYAGMIGLNGIILPERLEPLLGRWIGSLASFQSSELVRVGDLTVIGLALALALLPRNVEETFRSPAAPMKLNRRHAIAIGFIGALAILGIQQATTFVYFRF